MESNGCMMGLTIEATFRHPGENEFGSFTIRWVLDLSYLLEMTPSQIYET